MSENIVYEKETRIGFREEIALAAGQVPYVLGGTAVRTKKVGIIVFRAYAVGFYLGKDVSSLLDWESKSTACTGFYDFVSSDKVSKAVRLVLARDIPVDRMQSAFEECLFPRVKKFGGEEAMAKTMIKALVGRSGSMKNSTEIIFGMDKDNIVVYNSGECVYRVESPHIRLALCDLYLGPQSIVPEMKTSMQGRMPTILELIRKHIHSRPEAQVSLRATEPLDIPDDEEWVLCQQSFDDEGASDSPASPEVASAGTASPTLARRSPSGGTKPWPMASSSNHSPSAAPAEPQTSTPPRAVAVAASPASSQAGRPGSSQGSTVSVPPAIAPRDPFVDVLFHLGYSRLKSAVFTPSPVRRAGKSVGTVEATEGAPRTMLGGSLGDRSVAGGQGSGSPSQAGPRTRGRSVSSPTAPEEGLGSEVVDSYEGVLMLEVGGYTGLVTGHRIFSIKGPITGKTYFEKWSKCFCHWSGSNPHEILYWLDRDTQKFSSKPAHPILPGRRASERARLPLDADGTLNVRNAAVSKTKTGLRMPILNAFLLAGGGAQSTNTIEVIPVGSKPIVVRTESHDEMTNWHSCFKAAAAGHRQFTKVV